MPAYAGMVDGRVRIYRAASETKQPIVICTHSNGTMDTEKPAPTTIPPIASPLAFHGIVPYRSHRRIDGPNFLCRTSLTKNLREPFE